jgi:phosphoenolpyruvate---glycerone phosphotransferase subunit DhaL
MKDELNLTDFAEIIKNICKTLQENSNYLSELDSTVGDGDHGVTVARGFKSVQAGLEEDTPREISGLLRKVGLTLISSMGGAAGPIFGSIFTEMAKVAEGRQVIDLPILYEMFNTSLEKISKLGGAKPGDKTLIDSLGPAVASLKESVSGKVSIKEALKNMTASAEKGMLSTKNMVAAKGKARYLGERSLGYQDAGATTLYLIIKSIYEAI